MCGRSHHSGKQECAVESVGLASPFPLLAKLRPLALPTSTYASAPSPNPRSFSGSGNPDDRPWIEDSGIRSGSVVRKRGGLGKDNVLSRASSGTPDST